MNGGWLMTLLYPHYCVWQFVSDSHPWQGRFKIDGLGTHHGEAALVTWRPLKAVHFQGCKPQTLEEQQIQKPLPSGKLTEVWIITMFKTGKLTLESIDYR